jgi:hypothetical protein
MSAVKSRSNGSRYYVIDPVPAGYRWYRIIDLLAKSVSGQQEVAMFHEVAMPNARDEAYRCCQKLNQREQSQSDEVQRENAA